MDRRMTVAGQTENEVLWGENVVVTEYAGHVGRAYEPAPTSLAQLLDDGRAWTGRDFLVQGDRRVSHDQFRAAVPVAAQKLQAMGVSSGDRVVLFSYNRPEFVLAMCAAWWLGAVPIFANRWWSTSEILHAASTVDPELVLSDATDEFGDCRVRSILEFADVWDQTESDGRVRPVAVEDRDAPAMVLFTSGSSGAPKAVELSIRSVIANQHNLLARSRRLPHRLAPDAPQSVTLVCTPLFHIGGVSNVLTNLIIGGRLVLTKGRFDAGEILSLIQGEQVQSWGGVPTMAVRVLEHPDFDSYDLTSLRSFPLGGAPLPSSLLDRMMAKLPQLKKRGLANTWGMTESGGFVTVAGNSDLESRPGTVGLPYSVVELRIDNPDDVGSGEVLVRSPTVMIGYIGIDDGTVDADGWLHTGDLGHLDDDGYLYLDGRSKDIVIRGGENIACAHVEQALTGHPSVVEAAVFGVPHEDLGEELAAVVRCREGQPESADTLREHCRATLAYFELPSLWEIVDTPLPTLAGEKVDKKLIRNTFLQSRQEA